VRRPLSGDLRVARGYTNSGAHDQKSMAKRRVTNSLAAAAIMAFLAVHGATAQQTPSVPLPAGSTANFVYFDTGSYALTPEDQDHIRDVAGMMLSTPAVVATIIGKTDSVGCGV